ncbi:hypothetical protein KNO15_06145 [Leifsonia shinshuensis]|uniref:hypothetical protein n=1 Tax=Leifsonia shinshuensis TaxID=150026 RepID=UPI001F510259|nr:hypothetical protein [Leifsonia shinshuensis]MCI0156275.1 hypothetical protein [Leifsonia shinshuensis]
MTDATDDRVEAARDDRVEAAPGPHVPEAPALPGADDSAAPSPAPAAEAAPAAAPAQTTPEYAAVAPYSQGERVGRGIALALLVVPVGVVVWTLLWQIGFIASIVSWGVAIAAVWLYRVGSKARVTRAAAGGIITIVVVTVVLSLLAGMFTDLASAIPVPLQSAITDPKVWGLFADNLLSNGDMWKAYLPQVLIALVFAFLGCFTTLRRVSRESRA